MRNFYISIVTIFSIFSASLTAMHDQRIQIKDRRLGEYYEYDLEGSHNERLRRAVSFRTKKMLKAPFKAVRSGYQSSTSGIRRTKKEIELYLSASRSINGRRRNLDNALEQWSGQFKDYYVHDADGDGLLYVPKKSWAILKNALLTAGFRFPRATKRTLKSMVYGVGDCFKA